MAGTPGQNGRRGAQLSLAQVCAISYVLQLDSLERFAVALTQAALMARMLGSQVEVPQWSEIRQRFDAALAAEPKTIDAAQRDMLEAIGLRPSA